MSLERIILTIVIVTYGTQAAFWYDKTSNRYSVSTDDDDINDSDSSENYNDEVYDSNNVNSVISDYSDDSFLHERGVLERQLPISGEAKIKKSQTWCTVKRVTKPHIEKDYDFFPKSYSEYTCERYNKSQASSEIGTYSNDVCPVHHGDCVPWKKEIYFMKRKFTETCWKLAKRTVEVGCKCISVNPKILWEA